MKKTFKFFVAAVAAVMALGCAQEEVDVLTMGSTEINVSYQGGEQTLAFNTNAAWTIESDQDWVTFDVEEGVAGNAEVVMTVAANTTYEAREAIVTISAGKLFTEYVIKQGFATEFSADMEVNINFKAQVFEIEVNSNLAYKVTLSEGAEAWITSDALSKAAPSKETLSFNVAMNTGETRTAVIYLSAEGVSQSVLVTQGPIEPISMTSVKVTYLGQTQNLYDATTNEYNQFDEYYLEFSNEEGDKLALSVNSVMADSKTGVAAGVYAAGSTDHKAGTFTINDGTAKYYASAVVSGIPMTVIDGSVSVSSSKLVADVVDESGLSYSFSYSGDLTNLTEFEDKSFSANINATFGGAYTTYFTTGAYAWNLEFYVSSKAPGCDAFLRYFTVTFYTDNNVSKTELPVGTFTWAEPSYSTEVSYPQGTLVAEPGMMTSCTGNDNGNWDQNRLSLYSKENSTITISKNEDGTYKFNLGLKIQYYDWEQGYYGDVYDWNALFDNIEIGAVPQTSVDPAPDADAVFKNVTMGGISGYSFGDKFGTNGNLFMLQSTYINGIYNMTLFLNQDKSYEVNNLPRNGYSTNMFENGTYTFSALPVEGQKSILPAKYTANYTSMIQNTYTGTTYTIKGGSVTWNSGEMTVDLVATDGTNDYKFTGTYVAGFQQIRDYSANAAQLDRVTLPE